MAKIGRGGFGDVFTVASLHIEKDLVMKVENIRRCSNPRLYYEYRIYALFVSNENFPNVYWYGEETRTPTEAEKPFSLGSQITESMMVMDKLGCDLQSKYRKIKAENGRKFNDHQEPHHEEIHHEIYEKFHPELDVVSYKNFDVDSHHGPELHHGHQIEHHDTHHIEYPHETHDTYHYDHYE